MTITYPTDKRHPVKIMVHRDTRHHVYLWTKAADERFFENRNPDQWYSEPVIVFKDYAEASAYQLKSWLAGQPWHNYWSPGATEPTFSKSGGECCPDFSCCVNNMWPQEMRKKFVEGSDDDRSAMMADALGYFVKKHGAVVVTGSLKDDIL